MSLFSLSLRIPKYSLPKILLWNQTFPKIFRKKTGGGERCMTTIQERSKCDVDLYTVVPSCSTRRLNSRVSSADLSASEGRSSFFLFGFLFSTSCEPGREPYMTGTISYKLYPLSGKKKMSNSINRMSIYDQVSNSQVLLIHHDHSVDLRIRFSISFLLVLKTPGSNCCQLPLKNM